MCLNLSAGESETGRSWGSMVRQSSCIGECQVQWDFVSWNKIEKIKEDIWHHPLPLQCVCVCARVNMQCMIPKPWNWSRCGDVHPSHSHWSDLALSPRWWLFSPQAEGSWSALAAALAIVWRDSCFGLQWKCFFSWKQDHRAVMGSQNIPNDSPGMILSEPIPASVLRSLFKAIRIQLPIPAFGLS